MKKVLFFILLVLLISFIYIFNYYKDKKIIDDMLNTIESYFTIDDYSIFGTHFNISGNIDKPLNNLSLILKYDAEEINLNCNFEVIDNKTYFFTSLNNNEGIYLDALKSGKYLLLIKDNSNEPLYYSLINKTKYNNLEYYTITKNNSNNKIDINFKKNYVLFNIVESNLPDDVYDITIDPGHGGVDVGASYTYKNILYKESIFTLNVSKQLKNKLQDLGYKVKLTREDDSTLEAYKNEGRAVIPNKYNSKYSLSLHLNSYDGIMTYGGVEVYIPNDVSPSFASFISTNIAHLNKTGYSKKIINRVADGVYYNYFSKEDIEKANQEMINNGFVPYNITLNSPYMYMIREVGGKSTYAYVDGRNNYYGKNSFYDSNKTAEPYLIELGYINYEDDLKTFIDSIHIYSDAINNAIEEYFNSL